MNILLITNDLYPYLNANSEIAYRLAKELINRYEYNVSIIGYNKTGDLVFPNPDFSVKSIRIKSITEYSRIVETCNNKLERIVRYVLHPSVLKYHLKCKKNIKNRNVEEYQKELKRVLKRTKVDCIIAFVQPQDTLLAVSNLNFNIPVMAYMLDPWVNQYHNSDYIEKQQLRKILDEKIKKIVTTDLIAKELSTQYSNMFSNKTIVTDFPNITKYEKSIEIDEFKDQRIHCVFSGGLLKNIRDPKFAIELFNKLSDEQIVFHIFGYLSGENLLPEVLPSNVIFHGFVSNHEAIQYMQSADVLVNIGNSVTNQIPSKILTYISMGKPIINIMKLKNCPTLKYTKRFPLAINILETEEVQSKDVDAVRKFCVASKGKQIDFEEIRKEYYMCTPEYVAKQLKDTICEVLN